MKRLTKLITLQQDKATKIQIIDIAQTKISAQILKALKKYREQLYINKSGKLDKKDTNYEKHK